jgi:S1-C subfamily serine protease
MAEAKESESKRLLNEAVLDHSEIMGGQTNKYFYSHHGATFGPIPEPLLIRLAELGKILSEDRVWAEGAATAVQASECAVLASLLGHEAEKMENVAILSTSLWQRPEWLASVLFLLAIITVGIATFVMRSAPATTPNLSAPLTANTPTLQVPHPLSPSTSTPPIELLPAFSQRLKSDSFISNPDDERSVNAAVGFVVIGFKVVLQSGSILQRPLVTGSCFSITPDGFLLTNKHVVSGLFDLGDSKLHQMVRDRWQTEFEPELWVFFAGREFDGSVVYSSSRFDVAIIKIERSGQPFFRMAASPDEPRGGEVFAVGFPGLGSKAITMAELQSDLDSDDAMNMTHDIKSQFKVRDFDYTLTTGAVGRIFADGDGERWIQHEAVLRHGNSGGPLLDNRAIVLGINSLAQTDDDDVQTNISLEISQLRNELDRNVPGISWVSSAAR